MTYCLTPYDSALQDLLHNGVYKPNRTGVGAYSIFGYQAKYDISESFPVVTRRKLFPKSIFKELLWMLSGSTNVNDLEAMGSKIWSLWRDPEFEAQHGYADGELGPIYGWQLRHFGEDYERRHDNPQGFDQIAYLVQELQNNPNSRRILFTYWNPPEVTSNRVKLPPCHHTFQLWVSPRKELSGMLFQRSCDAFVGCPANIQFYSTLIYMLAQQCGYTPNEFIHSIGDFHLYENHQEAVKEYLSRPIVDSPTLKLMPAPSIFEYQIDNFQLQDYNPLERIAVEVAV